MLRNIIRAGWALLAWLVLFTPRGTALATHSSTHSSKHFQAPQALSLKLGNQVFNDLNNNGLRDADEPGVPGVLVRLLDASLTVVGSTRTDARGLYEFSALAPGEYSAEVVLPPTYQSSQNVASSATPDNGVDDDDNGVLLLGSVVRSQPVLVGADDLPTENLTLDFGIWQPARMGGWVWQDKNNDGLQDENELGLPDVEITLYTTDGSAITSYNTTHTDADGHYFFDELRPDTYAVGATLIEGYEFAPQGRSGHEADRDAANSSIDPLTGRTAWVSLQPGENNSHLDVGLFPTALQLSIALTAQPRPSQPGDPSALRPGDTVTYTIAITNIGNSTTTHVAVFNVVPIGAVYFADSATPALDTSSTASNLVWVTSTLSATQSISMSFAVRVEGASGSALTKLRNEAVVRSDQTPPNTSNRISHDVVPQTAPGPALSVIVLPEVQTITVGSTAVFTVQVTNTGGFDLYNTEVHPSALADCDHFVGDLAVGESISYTCQQPNVMATFTDTLTVSGLAGRASLALSSFTITVNLKPTARLGDYVWRDDAGDGLQRANAGMADVQVQLFRLNTLTTRVALSATTPVAVLSQTTDTHGFYMFDDVSPGHYEICVVPPIGYSFSRQGNTPTSGADSDLDPATGCTQPITASAGMMDANIDAGLVPVVMQLAQTSQPKPTEADNRLQVNIGDRITYTLSLRNTGLQPAHNVVVTDVLPTDVQVISETVSPRAVSTSGQLGWALADLAAGERYTMSFAVQVVSKINASVQNRAFVETTQTPATTSNDVVHVFAPTAVQLLSFAGRWVQADKTGIELTWQTGAEVNSFGFALYRSETSQPGDRVRITPEWIAAQNSHGASYAFVDETALRGKRYTYWLMEIERSGNVIEYDPIAVNTSTTMLVADVPAGGIPVAIGVAQPIVPLPPVLIVVASDAPAQSVVQVQAQPAHSDQIAGETRLQQQQTNAESAILAKSGQIASSNLIAGETRRQQQQTNAESAIVVKRDQIAGETRRQQQQTNVESAIVVKRDQIASSNLIANQSRSKPRSLLLVWVLAGLFLMLSLIGVLLALSVSIRSRIPSQ